MKKLFFIAGIVTGFLFGITVLVGAATAYIEYERQVRRERMKNSQRGTVESQNGFKDHKVSL